MHDSDYIKMRHGTYLEACFLFAMCVDLSGIALKDRQIAMASLLANVQDNSIIIFERRFRIILVFADVQSKYITSLFDKTKTTSTIDVSTHCMKNTSIAYKKDKRSFLWLDMYICRPIRKLLLSKLNCCMKRLIFLEFRQIKLDFQVSPIAFPDLEEDLFFVVSSNYYDRPEIPNTFQNVYDGKDVTRGPPTQKTRYSQFSRRPTRLATFANSEFFTDPQTFAEVGFFYRGQGDKVSCYECGVTLSQWQKDDDPLLEHIRFSPECQHISAILDPDTLHDYKTQFQKTRADEQCWREGIRQDKITSSPGCKIRSPKFASYNVRLSTFAKFPLISGINIHHVAAAGFYYTGHDDTVRCYACDGGLKWWKPGDDPWEEHFKWFPNCLHLEQANFKPQRKQTIVDEQSNYKPSKKQMKPEGSSEEFQDKSSTVDDEKASPGGLAGTLQGLNIGEIKEQSNYPQKHLSEPDLNTPAALAVLEFGYSKENVKMALNELRKNGQVQITANGILQVLFSCEDKDLKGKRENNVPNSNPPVSTHISSEEILTSTKPNKNATCDKQIRRILEETDDLKSKMMCKRCMKNARNMLLLPCTHFCLCDQCSKEISLCPECWKPIKERVKTYIS